MIEIKPIGTVLRVTADGYLASGLTVENIKSPWDKPAELLRQTYNEILDKRLHSSYIRGSVARGTAVEGVSDIDSIAVVDIPAEEIAYIQPLLAARARQLERQFPFLIFVELQAKPLAPILSGRNRIFRVLTHCSSVYMYGSDLANILPPVKPGPEAVVVAYDFERVYHESVARFTHQLDQVKPWHCRRAMKFMVRTGFEIVMEREQAWTRDLYPCYELFGAHYPERQSQMRQILELALNPTTDPGVVLPLLGDLGPWLIEQVRVWLAPR